VVVGVSSCKLKTGRKHFTRTVQEEWVRLREGVQFRLCGYPEDVG